MEFKEAGGYQSILDFYSQSTSDITEENPDLYSLCFQLLKILLFLGEQGLNQDAFRCFVDVFWKNSNLEIVLGGLMYLKQLADIAHDSIPSLL